MGAAIVSFQIERPAILVDYTLGAAGRRRVARTPILAKRTTVASSER